MPQRSTTSGDWLEDFAPDATARLHAERFLATLGRETPLVDGARSLASWVKSMHLVTGAHYLTCSDECESEAAHAFEHHFVRPLLPPIRFFDKAPFRSANLGGRYEWGSIDVAEGHFAHAKGAEDGKVMVVKLHAHVAAELGSHGARFGRMARYASEDSAACGALANLTSGLRDRPYLLELAEMFDFGPHNRLAELERVDSDIRPLVTAVVHARLQARRAMLDIQEHEAHGPTRYLVLATVTLNRRGHDTELPVGMYLADHLAGRNKELWLGVSDRPSEIRVSTEGERVVLECPTRPRPARDHRRMLREAAIATPGADHARTAAGRLAEATKGHHVAKTTLKALLPFVLELAPVPAAALLFGAGALSIHHAAKAHRLLDAAHRDRAAADMLANVQHEIDGLSPEEAEHALALLQAELQVEPKPG